MSGAELIALIGISASVIQVVGSCKKVLSRIHEISHQEGTLQDLAVQLPLLMKDVEAINSPEYRQSLDASTETALVRVLEGCLRQLCALDALLQGMMAKTPGSSSKLRQVWQGLRSVGKDTKLRTVLGTLAEYKSTIVLHLSSRNVQYQRGARSSNHAATATESFYDVPALAVSNFVGRKHIQDQIREAIQVCRSSPSVVVLTGAGGQGKSQLVLEFCRQSATHFKGIFWIDASSEASAVRGFEKIATKLNKEGRSFADKEAKLSFVKDILRAWTESWLLVFDNYDAPDVFSNVASFFPASGTDTKNVILVTSRNLLSERLGACVKVDGLTEAEAVELLLSRSTAGVTSGDDQEKAKELVKQLGYLALAIDQASAYISIRGLSMAALSEHYRERKEFILQDTPQALWQYRAGEGSSGPNLCVLNTWELSLAQMKGDGDERAGLEELLTSSAFLDSTSISEDLFKTYWQELTKPYYGSELRPSWMDMFTLEGRWDSFRFQDIVVELRTLSLVQNLQYTNNGIKFSLHPLIMEWLQIRNALPLRRKYSSVAISIVAFQVQLEGVGNLPSQDRLELLGHVDCSIDNIRRHGVELEFDRRSWYFEGIQQGFPTTLATFYKSSDRLDDAEVLLKDAAETQPRYLGEASVETLRTMNELGALYLEIGEISKAEEILTNNLSLKEAMFGYVHPRTLNTVSNLGSLYSKKGALSQAAKMYERALKGYERWHSYNRRHEALARAWNNLGEIALKKQRFVEAENIFKKALEMMEARKVDIISILHVKSNLALLYKCQHRYESAVEMYRQTITGRIATLGLKNSLTLKSMCELGDLYLSAGNPGHAKYWYTEGEADGERVKSVSGWPEINPQSPGQEPDWKLQRYPTSRSDDSSAWEVSPADYITWDNDDSIDAPTSRVEFINYDRHGCVGKQSASRNNESIEVVIDTPSPTSTAESLDLDRHGCWLEQSYYSMEERTGDKWNRRMI